MPVGENGGLQKIEWHLQDKWPVTDVFVKPGGRAWERGIQEGRSVVTGKAEAWGSQMKGNRRVEGSVQLIQISWEKLIPDKLSFICALQTSFSEEIRFPYCIPPLFRISKCDLESNATIFFAIFILHM